MLRTAWPGLWGGAGGRRVHALYTDPPPPLPELPGPLLPAMLLTFPVKCCNSKSSDCYWPDLRSPAVAVFCPRIQEWMPLALFLEESLVQASRLSHRSAPPFNFRITDIR